MQHPPGTPLADIVRQWLQENGRDLDRGGTPFSVEDLAVLLTDVSLSGRIYAVGHASVCGAAVAEGKPTRKRGPKQRAFEHALKEVTAHLESGEISRSWLTSQSIRALAANFGYHHSVMRKVVRAICEAPIREI